MPLSEEITKLLDSPGIFYCLPSWLFIAAIETETTRVISCLGGDIFIGGWLSNYGFEGAYLVWTG